MEPDCLVHEIQMGTTSMGGFGKAEMHETLPNKCIKQLFQHNLDCRLACTIIQCFIG